MATILNYNTTHLVSTPARMSSLRFTGSSRSQKKHKSFPVLVLAGNNSIPDISFKEFNTQLTNWANKQCLLVGTVGIAAYFASQSFFPAFILKTLYEFLSPLEASEIQQLLSEYSGAWYRPIVYTFLMRSPLILGRNQAIFRFTIESITYVIPRLRGKKKVDVPTAMIAGFGGGVMLSLVMGFRGPTMILPAVFHSLLCGLAIKIPGPKRPVRNPNQYRG